MIDEPNILHWRTLFPWPKMQQVEQDLLISRAVVAIYSDPFLAPRLAWRGGTALYKLHLRPQARYSEDIDLCCGCASRRRSSSCRAGSRWR